MRTVLFFALLALFAGFSSAEMGIDISYYQGALSQSTFQCFLKQGYQFLIIQAWIENEANPYFQQALQNAQSAGFNHIDAYAFICNECHGGQGGNVDNIISSMKSTIPSSFKGRIFLDIEACDGCWSSQGSKNFDFVYEVAIKLKDAGYHLGIYSSASAWQSIFGSDASKTTFSSLPLWYAHYNGQASFADYQSSAFGGWKTPEIKQYQGDATVCGTDVDLDFAGKNTTNATHHNNTNATHHNATNHTQPHHNKTNHTQPHKANQTKPHHPKNQTHKPKHQKPQKPKQQKPQQGGGSPQSGGGSPSGGGGSPSGGGGKPKQQKQKPHHQKPKHNGEHSHPDHNGEHSKPDHNGEHSHPDHNGENSFGNGEQGHSGEGNNNNSGEDNNSGEGGNGSGEDPNFGSGEDNNSFGNNEDGNGSGEGNGNSGEQGGLSGESQDNSFGDSGESGEDYFFWN